jgi:superfamily I DNA/RNA helicase
LAELKLDTWNKANRAYAIGGGAPINPEMDTMEERPQIETYGDKVYSSYSLYRAIKKDPKFWGPAVLRFKKLWEEWKQAEGLIDFTDLIEIGINTLDCPDGVQVVIADEAQDFSAMELDLLYKWGGQAGALMIAGDPYQSLYTWRGACPEVFLDQEVEPERRRVLHQSYRVSQAIHEVAFRWIKNLSCFDPTIEYKPTERPGEAYVLQAGTWRSPGPILDKVVEELVKDPTRRVMITGSCSYMLGPVVQALRERGIPFANPWRVKRGDWNPLGRLEGSSSTLSRILAFLRPCHGCHGVKGRRRWTFQDLDSWVELVKVSGVIQRGVRKELTQLAEEEKKEASEKGREPLPVHHTELEAIFEEEALEELQAILELTDRAALYGGGTPETWRLIEWLTKHLKSSKAQAASYPLRVIREYGGAILQEPPRLFVGTIHSFKGGEADSVYLFSDISRAAGIEWNDSAEHRDNVVRTFYVGFTRAKDRLVVCSPADPALAIPIDWLRLKTV